MAEDDNSGNLGQGRCGATINLADWALSKDTGTFINWFHPFSNLSYVDARAVETRRRAEAAKTARRLDWRRDADIVRTYDCVSCGVEVCTENLVDVSCCDHCDGQSDGDCGFCDDGVIIHSGATEIVYRDNRSMLRHDGRTFLCGDCACGTNPGDVYNVYWTQQARAVSPAVPPTRMLTGVSLERATQAVGKRHGYATDVFIASPKATTYNQNLEFMYDEEDNNL